LGSGICTLNPLKYCRAALILSEYVPIGVCKCFKSNLVQFVQPDLAKSRIRNPNFIALSHSNIWLWPFNILWRCFSHLADVNQ
jgi:hypothetical protein